MSETTEVGPNAQFLSFDGRLSEVDAIVVPALDNGGAVRLRAARRRVDAGSGPADFRGGDWWRLYGQLDVPHDRVVLHPGPERASYPRMVVAWA